MTVTASVTTVAWVDVAWVDKARRFPRLGYDDKDEARISVLLRSQFTMIAIYNDSNALTH